MDYYFFTSLAYLTRLDRLMDIVPDVGDLVATLLQLQSKSDDVRIETVFLRFSCNLFNKIWFPVDFFCLAEAGGVGGLSETILLSIPPLTSGF